MAKVNRNKPSEKRVTPKFIDTVWYQIWPVILAVFALVLLFFYIFYDNSGVVGKAIRDIFFGFFSVGSWVIPLALVKHVVTWKRDAAANAFFGNFVYTVLTVVFVSVFVHTIYGLAGDEISKTMQLSALYVAGKEGLGGGVIGGWLGSALTNLIGVVPTFIISLAALLVFVVFMIGLTPIRIAEIVGEKIKQNREQLEENAVKRAKEREEREKEIAEKEKRERIEAAEAKKRRMIDGIKEEDDAEKEKEKEKEEEKNNEPDEIPVIVHPKNEEEKSDINGELDLEQIFVNKENLALSKKILSGDPDDGIQSAEISIDTGTGKDSVKVDDPVVNDDAETDGGEEPPKEYQFPPIGFLAKDSVTKVDAEEELNLTADKLVRTLESFGVKTTVINVSRGPAVTRYELQPQIGVKVRQIGNLVDDIALHLAAKGAVRIEAPIPGKSAVGIEIPNQSSTIVRLRGLIENPQFTESKSKLTCALGEDVAGNPVYMNVASMPHLLIAGATGMGKSVCINSLIISILYKAKPEEVKLILIDPKKVELNMYNEIPHLIVPVVSDPKKAAGSLRWAVNEMERRFQLMDECGARDLAGYNDAAKADPELETLPEIVIIIDELADLMMTAPSEVEDTICRIAQKARAAGMHLVIGTQRPSVDVITGLIKANIPSRIAFTVASQVDSRTIIDIAGAEKLCGKGDMLYAPVGISKPIRVQGSFVSTSEVERVCEFLKSESKAAYDENVAKSIEIEASKCGVKGAAKERIEASAQAGADGEGTDEMLMKAIEIAVEAGANGISTSMLQRRLSLGYARAGRIIDTMESMGIIGGFEGAKPRKVLITKEQFAEMRMNGLHSSQSGASEDDNGAV